MDDPDAIQPIAEGDADSLMEEPRKRCLLHAGDLRDMGERDRPCIIRQYELADSS